MQNKRKSKGEENSDSLTCSGNEKVRLSLTTILVSLLSAHGRLLFQFSFVVAPVLSYIIYPG
jgi:hypothetical protein